VGNELVTELQKLEVSGVQFGEPSYGDLNESTFSELEQMLTASERRRNNKQYQKKVAEAARLIEKAVKHPHGHVILREALRVADFPTYFGDVLDRMVLARFSEWVPPFQAFMKTGTFRDLTRTSRKTQFRGGNETLLQVGEFGPYPERGTSSTDYSWKGAKYGADFRISWETMLADDLGALTDLPGVLASAARIAEARFATGLYVDANGPHASFFTTGNTNLLQSPNNPVLTITSIEQAYTLMRKMKDPVTGNPIMNGPAFLVVPPALEVTAMKVLGTPNVFYTPMGSTATPAPQPTINAVASFGLTLVVDPFIPIIAASANGDTSWFLFANPNSGPLGPGLGAMEFDRLVGMTAPLLLQRRSQFTTIGGGTDPRGPLDDLDSMTYRVVHAFGGGQLITQAAVASNGSGT